MASIRKRGNSYLLVVSMGYDPEGHRRKPQQKTVHPPEGLTPKAKEKWLEEEAALFERQCKNQPLTVDKSITLAEYTAYWLAHIAPGKLAKSTLARDKQDIDRFLPTLGSYKLTGLKPEHFRNLYAQLRKQKNSVTGNPLSESTAGIYTEGNPFDGSMNAGKKVRGHHRGDDRELGAASRCCLKALSLIHGHKRESSAKKKRVCLTWGGQIRVPS